MNERQPLPIVSTHLPKSDLVFDTIAIVGLGFVGGSIALAARQVWPSALIIGVDEQTIIETAVRMQAIDVGADDLVVAAGAELVILAAPVVENIRLLAEFDGVVQGRAVITDVGGSKRAMDEASAILPERLTFIGGDPLAGGPLRGIGAARPDLFVGRPWILTPGHQADPAGLERLRAFVAALGAEVRTMTSGEHDRLVAYLSHAPQVVINVLMQVVGEQLGEHGLALAGRGLMDATRLAMSPASPWKDVLATNQDLAGQALDGIIDLLSFVRSRLDSGETIEGLFESAAYWRARMPARRPSEPS
jgi:prephenate dehydrogenase